MRLGDSLERQPRVNTTNRGFWRGSETALIYVDGFWVFVGAAPIRLSTIVTFFLVFVFVAWRFRVKGWVTAFYNGSVSALFMLFLYEVLFNITGRFPPWDMLPFWGVGLLACSLLLGLLQAKNYLVPRRLSTILFSAFIVDWLVWILVGFPFNLPSTDSLSLVAESFNVSTKLLLPFAYATALNARKLERPKS
jgi:hypothetical protein